MDSVDIQKFFSVVLMSALVDYRKQKPRWVPSTEAGYKSYVDQRLKAGREPSTFERWEAYRRQRLECSQRVWAYERKEAKRWFYSNDSSYLCSFVHVCTVLELDPSAVRRDLNTARIPTLVAVQTKRRVTNKKEKVPCATPGCERMMRKGSKVCWKCNTPRANSKLFVKSEHSRFERPYYDKAR